MTDRELKTQICRQFSETFELPAPVLASVTKCATILIAMHDEGLACRTAQKHPAHTDLILAAAATAGISGIPVPPDKVECDLDDQEPFGHLTVCDASGCEPAFLLELLAGCMRMHGHAATLTLRQVQMDDELAPNANTATLFIANETGVVDLVCLQTIAEVVSNAQCRDAYVTMMRVLHSLDAYRRQADDDRPAPRSQSLAVCAAS